MFNLVNVILAIFLVVQFQGINCNPVYAKEEVGAVQRNLRIVKPDNKEWMHFHHSWGLPHFPFLTSVGNFFQDEDDKEKIAMTTRLETLEKNQKEILTILQKLNNEITSKKDQTKPQPLDEKPQTPMLDDKTPTIQPSTEKEVTTKKIEKEHASSTDPITDTTTILSVYSMASSTFTTHAPVVETSTVEVITQQPQSSPSSEASQPQTPDQNENVNSNSNSNTADNNTTADSAGQQSSPPSGTNSGSIVGFTSDEEEKKIETTQSAA